MDRKNIALLLLLLGVAVGSMADSTADECAQQVQPKNSYSKISFSDKELKIPGATIQVNTARLFAPPSNSTQSQDKPIYLIISGDVGTSPMVHAENAIYTVVENKGEIVDVIHLSLGGVQLSKELATDLSWLADLKLKLPEQAIKWFGLRNRNIYLTSDQSSLFQFLSKYSRGYNLIPWENFENVELDKQPIQ